MTETIEKPNGQHGYGAERPVRPATLNQAEFELHQLAVNALAQRQTYFQQMMDPRRDLDKECGYPGTYAVGADLYRTLYDREPIATRVVQLMPKECWQKTPLVYEDEDSENVTEFEDAWDNLDRQVSPEKSWYQDEEGSSIWYELCRVDELAGIGSFGIILLGLSDGKDFREPVEGLVSDKYVRDRKGKKKVTENGSPRIDLSKLSFPTAMPTEEQLDSLVKNSATPPIQDWGKDEGHRVDHHVAFSPGKALSPFVTRNASGQAVLSLKNAAGQELTTNEIKTVAEMIQGTDAQYMGVQIGPQNFPVETPIKGEMELTFLRSFSEDLVQIVQYEANIRNPRFGLPVTYRITFNDPRHAHTGIGLPMASIYVHWTRVIHVLPETAIPGSKTFGVPRMRPVLNPLLDIRKIRGSGAEGYWQSCFAGIALSTHPQLGGEVEINKEATREMIESYMNGLQRWLVLSGMAANTIAPTVTDPTPHIAIQIEAVCIQLGCPVRVFKGSERGELASSQDDSAWNDRVRQRQHVYVTPGIICKFIDRLILLGVLPEPEGYSVEWPNLDSLGDKDKAAIFAQRMTAFSTYAQGVEAILPVREMLTLEAGYDDEEADEIIEANEKAQEEGLTSTMPPMGEEGHPATVKPPQPPSPVVLGPGQTMAPNPNDPNSKGKPFTAPGKPAPQIAAPPQAKPPFVKNAAVENADDEGRWVTLPSGAHIQVKDGEIVKGPKIGKAEKGDTKARDQATKDIKRIMKDKGIKHEEDRGDTGSQPEGDTKARDEAMAEIKRIMKEKGIKHEEDRGNVGDKKSKGSGKVKAAQDIVEGMFPGLKMKQGYKADAIDRAIFGAGRKVKDFFKSLRRQLAMNKAEWREFKMTPTYNALFQELVENANPEGCNQYKECGAGGDENDDSGVRETLRPAVKELREALQTSANRANWPREKSQEVVDKLKDLGKDTIKEVVASLGKMKYPDGSPMKANLYETSKKGMLKEIYNMLDASHRAYERIQS